MENGNKFTLKSSSPQNLLSRRDLLLSATASAAISPTLSSSSSSAAAVEEFPIKLEGTVSRVVGRPRKSRSKREKEDEEEVLVIDGIEFDSRIPVKFDVYVNDDCSDGGSGPTAAEFAGSMVNVPHGRGRMRTGLRLGITDLIEDVGADDDDSLLVTLVPKSGVGLVTVGSIGIQFLS
ncbi:Polyphenol oxidase [Morus notabilis]|uniref:Polyphenol oxidase n=2 Tax=Morus notabilis TaxID=981085 RepID=W9RQ72_9ROSA|nr:Polyphenol oxidase [Morus notabilis]